MGAPLRLLVESDSHARGLHELVLSSAGYVVISTPACPELEDVRRAALIIRRTELLVAVMLTAAAAAHDAVTNLAVSAESFRTGL